MMKNRKNPDQKRQFLMILTPTLMRYLSVNKEIKTSDIFLEADELFREGTKSGNLFMILLTTYLNSVDMFF